MFFITNGIDNYRKIFCYKGVASRNSYVFFSLFQILPLLFLDAIDIFFDLVSQVTDLLPEKISDLLDIVLRGGDIAIGIIVLLSLLLADISISARRLHDIGLSGWFTLAPAVIILAVQFIVFSWFEFELEVGISIGMGIVIVIDLVFHLLLALPKSKIENNKYRPADSIFTPATDEAVS
ncbi:DUF805 domain-containing protein [Buttiauxella sp. 3AFRM03]|uniref:DUF805 domain-containing protein n=1 Tax=Buttiauxella sp. 3AFRM03 TaxID=2479367 RepID=UPI0013904213|nr:DUF805 domain-containing protein [Buttiauxella sp. 3AFRM03]